MENDKANVKVAALTAELQALRVELAAYKMQSDVMPSSDGDESTPLIDEDALQQLVKGMSTVGDDKDEAVDADALKAELAVMRRALTEATARSAAQQVLTSKLERQLKELQEESENLKGENKNLQLKFENPMNRSVIKRKMTVAEKCVLFNAGGPVNPVTSPLQRKGSDGGAGEITLEQLIAQLEEIVRQGSSTCEVHSVMLQSACESMRDMARDVMALQEQVAEAVEQLQSGSQTVKPSAWAQREQKYKNDLATFNATIKEQKEQLALLNVEVQAFRSGCYVDNLQGQIRDLKHEIGDLKEDKQAARDVVRASVQYKNKLAECPELSTALAELSVRCGGAAACGANRVGRNESGAVSLPTPTGFASGLPLLDVGGLPSPACTPSSPDRTVTSKYNQLKELQTELARLKEENAKLAKEKLDSGRHIAEIERLKEQLAEAEAKAQAAAAGPGTPRVGGASALLDLHQQVSRLQTSLDAAEEARRKSALEVARLSGELEAAKQNARSGGAAFAAPAPGSPRGSPATSPRHLVDGGASSAELASKLATAKDMIARLQRELAESQTAVVGSKVDFTLLEPLQAEIASLNAKLAEREKEVAKLQSVAAAVVPAAPAEADPQQLAEFRFKLAAAEAQAKGLNDEVAKLRNQLASSELVEADLKSQLAAREEAYEALRADLAAQEEQVELLARSSGNFDVVLAELNAELAAKRTEVAKLTAELGAAAEGRRAAHEGHKAALAATGAEISALQKQLKELKDANASMTAAAAAAASKTHNVTELEVLVKELASFKDQVDRLSHEHRLAEAAKAEQAAQIRKLTSQLEQANAKAATTESQMERMQASLDAADVERAELNSLKDRLCQEVNTLTSAHYATIKQMESKLKRSPVKGMLSMFKPGGGGNSAGLAALPPSTLHRSRTNSSGGSVKDGDEMRADYETKITGLTAQIVAAKSAQQRAMDENKFLMGALVQTKVQLADLSREVNEYKKALGRSSRASRDVPDAVPATDATDKYGA